MVAPIVEKKGIVDKYIGDAIKAFFGAQADSARKENVGLAAVTAALEMTERLVSFNAEQSAAGRPEFRNGVGLTYGVVTIGNIGTEKKKEYTVIGETVDLAEHLESLTKEYVQPLIISESLQSKVKDELPCRVLDAIPWRGGRSIKIYSVQRSLTPRFKEAWDAHNSAMAEYFERGFARAGGLLRDVLKILPEDRAAALLLERCVQFQKAPPPPDWKGGKVRLAS
jgi:class 3 adenylate cyclase